MSSERSLIVDFLRSIDVGDFIALAPSRERFDQDEEHDEARRIADERGVADPGWVFWHHQSDGVFDINGNLTSGLRLHWGGDHDKVLTALAAIPAPLRIIDHGPGGAIEVVSDATQSRLTADFPDVADTTAVKARIKAITGPVSRRKPETWTLDEHAWFEDVLVHGSIAAQAAVVGWITESPDLSDASLDYLVANWTSIYTKAPGWVLISSLLRQLDRRDDPRLDDLLDIAEKRKGYAFRAGASLFLVDRLRADPHGAAAQADLERLARFAHDPGRYDHTPGNGIALRGLVKILALRDNRTEAEVAVTLLSDTTFDASARNQLAEFAG
ncbi:hypothetical protein GII33_20915 [Gordonia pseudamarae]|mgnify:CR=1 FL=1|uniref:Uncharacterized protein n=1 Tax=Gordonia pseudamarae TaxID=2831662 RepID=A0ABX6IMK9_9ACTN|nr:MULTISPECIES: hypothetical protein [Gordonia]MBD0021966.1 hypothetical protein [Gordonia sp. (in: high G+C Gram-positive bacteria)]QHN28069.1 hypothetical protein GII33_20915 [Gordonia pseudamarae]QHN36931.1 hypothetical protein GII31_20550 [Gordonia pseudamarae]